MSASGRVQEGSGGRTCLTVPPDPDAFLPGRGVFSEFDVPSDLEAGEQTQNGDKSLDRANARMFGAPPTEMPPVTNIYRSPTR